MRLVPALALLVLPVLAQAQERDRPLTTPTRDVDVIYRIAGPDAPLAQQMRWGVTLGKLRVDPPSPGMFVVIDTATHSIQTVREADRSVLLIEGGPDAAPGGVASTGGFTRKATAEVAGHGCTEWETQDTSRRPVAVCLTADWVLLRAKAGGLVLVEATSVQFAPQSAAVFRVPADYRRITMPSSSQQRQ